MRAGVRRFASGGLKGQGDPLVAGKGWIVGGSMIRAFAPEPVLLPRAWDIVGAAVPPRTALPGDALARILQRLCDNLWMPEGDADECLGGAGGAAPPLLPFL